MTPLDLSLAESPRIFAVGDVHGDVARLKELLQAAEITDAKGRWIGGESILVFTGDLTDRGPEGTRTIEFVRGLQNDAAQAGGEVESLMGNHDALILARAFEFRGERADPDCRDLFRLNGGSDREAKELGKDEEAFAWMQTRPLMRNVDGTLFQHADTVKYYRTLAPNGGVDEANERGQTLATTGKGAWEIFYGMTEGRGWDAVFMQAPSEIEARFLDHLARYDAERVVHGHTRHLRNGPLAAFGGKALNIDGSMSSGYRKDRDRGFVADLGLLATDS